MLYGYKSFAQLQAAHTKSTDGFACCVGPTQIWIWVRYYGDKIPRKTTQMRKLDGTLITFL